MNDVSTGTVAPSPDDSGIVPSDEREEILKEIEEGVRLGRTPLQAAGSSGASGSALPAIVNAGTLLVIVLAINFVPRLYDVGERRMVNPAAVSDEAAGLFRALRQQADVQIQERESEIESLQAQYDRVRAERESLRRDFDSRLKSRADELQTELQSTIEAEKLRLGESGISATVADARLRELEARLQAQRSQELESYGAQLQAESARREQELAAAQARFGEELRQRTDPLAAEIERLTAQGQAQLVAQRDLQRRYDESQAHEARLEAELKNALAERDGTSAALRRDLQESAAAVDRLQKAEAARTALRDRLDEILRRYPASSGGLSTASTALEGKLDLLAAKVEARSIIASEPVQSSHPGLSARLDRYFMESEKENRAEGLRDGIDAVIEIIDMLAAGRKPLEASEVSAESRRLLEKLGQLLK